MNTNVRNKEIIVGLKELRENMEKYIEAIGRGEKITVLRRSKPIFTLVSPSEEAQWENIIDFTEIDKKGVPAEDVLATLRSM